jgi:hypothetical protein
MIYIIVKSELKQLIPANLTRPTGALVTRTAIFRPGKNILKTKIFRDETTVLNERNHLKIVFGSVQDSIILFFRPIGTTGPDSFTPPTSIRN